MSTKPASPRISQASVPSVTGFSIDTPNTCQPTQKPELDLPTNGSSPSNSISQQKSSHGRPRSYSSRSKENLLQVGATENPYSAVNQSHIPNSVNPSSYTTSISQNSPDANISIAISPSTIPFSSEPESEITADDVKKDSVNDTIQSSKSTGGFASKILSGTGFAVMKRKSLTPLSSFAPESEKVSPGRNNVGPFLKSSAARKKSNTLPIDLGKTNNPPKKIVNEKVSMASHETFQNVKFVDTFAYFCKVDNEPRLQRKILFAINHRHAQIHRNRSDTNSVLQDLDHDKKSGGKRSSSLIAIGGKLNSLLKKNKQKRTRSGIFHSLNLTIHDFRAQEGLSLIDILSENTIQKKRSADTNKALLHAMCNRLQSLALSIMEKGFPFSPNNPIFASNEKYNFSFPSYFQLAVALDLVEVVKIMLKNKADVDITWYQMSPLMTACLKGSRSMVTLLLEADANPNQKILLEDFLLLRRLKTSKKSIKLAARYSDYVGFSNISSTTAMLGNLDGMQENEKYRQFGYKGHVRLTQEYIGEKHVCLFEMAAINGDYQIASYLLGITDTALISSSSFALLLSENHEWTKRLISAGVSLNQSDCFGSTCLHLAARRGDLDMVIIILQGGMDINSKGANGWTALHEAISMSHIQVFQYLLFKSADKSITNNSMDTPLNIAEKRGFDQDTLNLFFKEPGDVALFIEREKTLAELEIKLPTTLESESFLSTSKGIANSSSDRGKFGSLFGKSSSSSPASTINPSKLANPHRRSFFGRSSSTSGSK